MEIRYKLIMLMIIWMTARSSLRVGRIISISAWANLTSTSAINDVIANKRASGQYGYRLFVDARGKANVANLSDGVGDPPFEYWNFDEYAGTTVNDVSGNGNTGTWNGTGPVHWAPGKYGSAGNFNGTDDYVSLPLTASLKGASAITIAAWVKINTIGGGDDKQIFYEP